MNEWIREIDIYMYVCVCVCVECVLVAQSCPTLCDLMNCNLPDSSVRGIFPGKNTGEGCHSLLQGDVPNPRIKLKSPALQVDSLPSKPQGSPYITLKMTEIFICTNMNEPGEHYTKWNKPDRERKVLPDLTYM